MPNWSILSNGINASVPYGDITALVLDITIVPNATYSIVPSSFIIGEAIETDGQGNPSLSETNIWEGGNVDSVVNSVTFIQSGDNVIARVSCDSVSYVADTDIFIDIDENTNNPVTNEAYGACLNINYPDVANSNVGIVVDSDGLTTETLMTSGNASVNWVKRYTRYDSDMGLFYSYATMTITAATGYHLVSIPSVLQTPSMAGGGGFSSGAFMNGNSTVATISITYSSTPTSLSTTPCQSPTTVFVDYDTQQDAGYGTNGIHGVMVNTQISQFGGSFDIKVNGDEGAKYDVSLQNKSNSDYYDWDGTFSSGVTTDEGIIVNGSSTKSVIIPRSDSAVNYDIIIASVEGSVLGSNIPVSAGQLQMKQYGRNLLTIKPTTYNSSRFGTLNSADHIEVSRPVRYDGDNYEVGVSERISIKGKTIGSSTTVSLSSLSKSLKAGMVVVGENIPHHTLIDKIYKDNIYVSNPVNLPVSQVITCYTNNSDLVPFSFTITPNNNTLSIASGVNPFRNVFGLGDKVSSKQNSGITTVAATPQNIVLQSTLGILPGMSLKSTFASGGSFISYFSPHEATVTSVTNLTSIVVSHSLTTSMPNQTLIWFSGAGNPSVSLEEIKVEASGLNVVVRGYLLVPKLENTSTVEIYLDNIITA
jgi:hypothetical protein